MNRFVKLLFLVMAVSCISPAYGQDKEELQEDRDRISEAISLTNKLIQETRASRSKVEGELGLINKKIDLREDLIRSLSKEIALYNREIEKNEEDIARLEKKLEELKESYAEMIRFAQRSQRAEDRLMFIFASEDFFQALRRIRYLQQYADFRKKQAAEIVEKREELDSLNSDLAATLREKNELMESEESVKEELTSDLQQRQTTVSGLKSEERALVKKLRKQEKQREELNKEIQRIIEAEIRASKKDNAGVFALTPEAAALSAEFENNKGKLPWPVERGVITSNFGENPHPVLGGITVINNGVDIATNRDAPVRAVFEGTVSGVFAIPGAGQNIIVNHGGYRSVYSHLKEVFVSKGQKVEAKQSIGTVLTDDVSGKTEAHLEIWNVSPTGTTTKQDPAKWIYHQ